MANAVIPRRNSHSEALRLSAVAVGSPGTIRVEGTYSWLKGAITKIITATVIMVEPVCRTRDILRNCDYVLRAVFPTEILGARIYSSVVFGGSMVLANAVGTAEASLLPGKITKLPRSRSGVEEGFQRAVEASYVLQRSPNQDRHQRSSR